MKFTRLVATLAIIAFAVNANAYSDGTLRRGSDVKVAQNDTTTSKEVNININTNAAQAQAAQAQPATVVEAAPVAESKAEGLRKARVDAEVQTEQKIVEKLEDSRLQEEKARADRLFGNKLDPQQAPAPAPAPVPVVAAPAPAPAPAPEKPAQVTIEKVEIIQPAAPIAEKSEPVAESKAEVKEEKSESAKAKYYVSGLAGNLSYQANNVHSNYGLGVAVGTILDERVALELSYFYSNSTIDDIQDGAIYHKLDQSDVAVSGKYYLLSGKLKPYLGGSVSYINRKYQDVQNGVAYGYGYGYGNYGTTTETTQAVDMGVLAGVDFAINDQFMVGLGLDYNFNVMTMNNLNNNKYYYWNGYSYQSLPNVQQLEKINFYAIKANAKFTF